MLAHLLREKGGQRSRTLTLYFKCGVNDTLGHKRMAYRSHDDTRQACNPAAVNSEGCYPTTRNERFINFVTDTTRRIKQIQINGEGPSREHPSIAFHIVKPFGRNA